MLASLMPYAVVVASLVAGAVGAPVPEEAIVLSAGAAAHRGLVDAPVIAIVAYAAVVVTDAIVFAIGHRLGRGALDRRPARWLLTPARRARVERLVAEHHGSLVLAARFVPGLRAPALLVLGAHRLRATRFLALDALAAGFSVPLLLALGYAGSSSVARITGDVRDIEIGIAIVAALAIGWLIVARRGAARAATMGHGGDT